LADNSEAPTTDVVVDFDGDVVVDDHDAVKVNVNDVRALCEVKLAT
jgi:hypothetical protein